MTFLPIVERELRGRARRRFTYWLRVGVGAFGIFICLVQFIFSNAAGSTAGDHVFNALLTAAFIYCCCACLMTATAISSERSEVTLPLLFLTRVTSNDVLIGKLLPSLLAGLCAVGAFLPVLMIPVLSGGVTGGETIRSALVLIHTLFLSLVLGLRASVRATNWMAAIRGAILLMLGWLFLPFVLGTFGMCIMMPWPILSLLSPLQVLILASDRGYQWAPTSFWIGLGVLQVVAWALLLKTATRLRSSLTEPPPEIVRPVADPWAQLTAPIPETLYRSIGEGDPLQWLIRRQHGVRSLIWFGAVVGMLSGFIVQTFSHRSGLGIGMLFAWPVSLAFNVLETGLFAWAISRFFVQARQTGELELVGTTPHGARMLVTAQQLAMKGLFRGPIILMMVPIGLRLLAWLSSFPLNLQDDWPWFRLGSILFSGVNLGIGVSAVIWTGIWVGLTASNQGRALASTVWWVTAFPTVVVWGLSMILNVIVFGLNGVIPEVIAYFLPHFMLTAVFLWLIQRAKRRLAREMRDAEMSSGSLFSNPAEKARGAGNEIRETPHWTTPP